MCSVVSDSATLWAVAHHPPLSLGFSRWKYWSRLPLSPPGDLPNPGIEPTSPGSPALQEDSWLLRHPGSTPTPWIRIDTFHCVIQSICNTKNCKEQHFSMAGDILRRQSMAYRIAMEMGWGSGWGRKAQFWCWFCYQLWAKNKHSIALLWHPTDLGWIGPTYLTGLLKSLDGMMHVKNSTRLFISDI